MKKILSVQLPTNTAPASEELPAYTALQRLNGKQENTLKRWIYKTDWFEQNGFFGVQLPDQTYWARNLAARKNSALAEFLGTSFEVYQERSMGDRIHKQVFSGFLGLLFSKFWYLAATNGQYSGGMGGYSIRPIKFEKLGLNLEAEEKSLICFFLSIGDRDWGYDFSPKRRFKELLKKPILTDCYCPSSSTHALICALLALKANVQLKQYWSLAEGLKANDLSLFNSATFSLIQPSDRYKIAAVLAHAATSKINDEGILREYQFFLRAMTFGLGALQFQSEQIGLAISAAFLTVATLNGSADTARNIAITLNGSGDAYYKSLVGYLAMDGLPPYQESDLPDYS